MAGYNKISLIGNVGAAPEMTYTVTGDPVTNFSLAVNERRRGADGQQHETTTWFRIACWGRLAEIAGQYVTKGAQVHIEGPLTVREFTGNQGEKRFALDVRARELTLLGSAPHQDEGDPGDEREPALAGSTSVSMRPAARPGGGGRHRDDSMDDVPF